MGEIHPFHLPVHHHLGLIGRGIEVALPEVLLDGSAEASEGEQGEGDLHQVGAHHYPQNLSEGDMDPGDIEGDLAAEEVADAPGDEDRDTSEDDEDKEVRQESEEHRTVRFPPDEAVVDGLEKIAHPPEGMVPVGRVADVAVEQHREDDYQDAVRGSPLPRTFCCVRGP